MSKLGVELVVIGAIAYRAFISARQRHTEDIDVALALNLDDFGASTRVVPPEVLAYLDDPHRRAKDLEDIHGLLKSYEGESDRTFSDAVFAAGLPDVEFIPAFPLGTDVHWW